MTAVLSVAIEFLPTCGRWIVDTYNDTYDIDVDGSVFIRTAMHDSDSLQEPDEPQSFALISCKVGEPIKALCRATQPDGSYVHLSLDSVIGITPYEVSS